MLTPKHTRIYPKRGTSCCPNSVTSSKLGHPYLFSQGFFSLKGNRNPLFFFVMCNKRKADWGPTAGAISTAHRFGANPCIFLN